jgi:hypothetical protein
MDGTDNGAVEYINAAQRMLDRKTGFIDDTARHFTTIDAGTFFVEFENARTIDTVWAATADDSWELDRESIEDLKDTYAGPFGDVDQGAVLYFAFTRLRTMPDSTALDALPGYGTEVAVDGSQRSSTGIIILPPTDEEIQIEVWGKFYSPKLVTDLDTSYWTENHPETLLKATMYQLEVDNRNTEGMKDWLAAIELDAVGIEFDFVELVSNDATVMEG